MTKRSSSKKVVANNPIEQKIEDLITEAVNLPVEEEAGVESEDLIPEEKMLSVEDQIKAEIKVFREKKKSTGYINTIIADEYKMSVSKVSAIHKKLLEEEGLTTGSGAQGDMGALVRCLRKNHGKVDRKDLVSMMAEVSGYTESTANHMLSQLNFAKEWAAQEMAAKAAEETK